MDSRSVGPRSVLHFTDRNGHLDVPDAKDDADSRNGSGAGAHDGFDAINIRRHVRAFPERPGVIYTFE